MALVEVQVKIVNEEKIEAMFKSLGTSINEKLPLLYNAVGPALVTNIRRRIQSQDGGKWQPASKWLRAKSGQSQVLKGAERYVNYRIAAKGLEVLGKGGKWTLTQHHEGFENKLADPSEPRDGHGRVILTIKDAAPLHLYQEFRRRRNGQRVGVKTTFAFVPQKPGHTPARKIWPTQAEAQRIVDPLSSRWLTKLVQEATT